MNKMTDSYGTDIYVGSEIVHCARKGGLNTGVVTAVGDGFIKARLSYKYHWMHDVGIREKDSRLTAMDRVVVVRLPPYIRGLFMRAGVQVSR
jgi:hypothetical protein